MSALGDTLFALVHAVLLLGLLGLGVLDLIRGKTQQGLILLAGLVLYYFLVLHKPVLREIERRRGLKKR
jgi:hypothetical protein